MQNESQDVVEVEPPGGGAAAAAVGAGAIVVAEPMESDEWADELPLVRRRDRRADDAGLGKGKDKSKGNGCVGKDKAKGGKRSEIVQLRTYVASLMTRLGLPTELLPTIGVDQLRPMVGHMEELLAKRSQSG